MRRILVWGVIALVAIFAGVGAYLSATGKLDVTMNQEELQAKIDAKLPHTSEHRVTVTVSKATLDLSHDQIGLAFNAQASKFGKSVSVEARTRGDLRYEPMSGSFYFKPSALEFGQINLGEMNVREGVSHFIEKWVDSPKLNARRDELGEKAETVVKSGVEKAVTVALERVPVYKLPDNFKGNMARMLLSSVEVNDGKVIAHLSFWHFTEMLVLYAVLFVLAIGLAAAMIMCPDCWLALALLGSF